MPSGQLIINKEIQSQAKTILKGLALAELKPRFFINVKTEAKVPFNFALVSPEAEDQPVSQDSSFDGIPVFDNLILGTNGTDKSAVPGGVTAFAGGIKFTTLAGKEISLGSLVINMVLMEVNRQKQIVKTQIPGSDISVKEIISASDYQISIRGGIVSKSPYTYPIDDVKGFVQYVNAPIAIPVTSNFLGHFGINTIVIESCRMYQVEGMRNIQFFEITAISDDVSDSANVT